MADNQESQEGTQPVEGQGTMPIPTVPPQTNPASPLSAKSNLPPAGQPPEQATPTSAEDDSVSEEELDETPTPKQFDEDYVKELRQENAKRRKQLREVQAQLDALTSEQNKSKNAKLKEQEKWKDLYDQEMTAAAQKDATIAELQNRLKLSSRQAFVQAVATEMNAHDIRDANFEYMLSNDELFDEDDDDKTLKTLLVEFKALQKAKSHLFKAAEDTQPRQERQQLPINPAQPNGQPQTPNVPSLQKFAPAQSTQVQQTDEDRLNRLRHRMGQRTTVFGRNKTF